MRQGMRAAVFDEALGVEAFRFDGIAQPFPGHFHEYYVVGLVKAGKRELVCNGQRHDITPGSVVVFNPGDVHSCQQCGCDSFSYLSLNVPQAVMGKVLHVGRKAGALRFSCNVIADGQAGVALSCLHAAIMEEAPVLERRRCFEAFLDSLVPYADQLAPSLPVAQPHYAQIEGACEFMHRCYADSLRLDQLCSLTGLSASTLLRAFAAAKGITPFRYLEVVRVQAAKALLAQGTPLAQTAACTGFSDQSHLTNRFGALVGLTPGCYRDVFARREDAHE